MSYSLKIKDNRAVFRKGMIDGIPISLGYLAVSFSLGVAAKSAGVTPFQGFLASLLCNTSTGEHAVFTLMGANAAFLEVALVTLIANARYLLMSFAMSQRMHPKMPFFHRFFMAYDLSDELFGIAIAREGYLNPLYTYGATLTAAPGWAFGTAIGILAGSVLPDRFVSALSVALYGMFLAVIIPPAKKDRIVAVLILISFALSFIVGITPVFADISEGTRTIILTVVLSSLAAILFPKKNEEGEE